MANLQFIAIRCLRKSIEETLEISQRGDSSRARAPCGAKTTWTAQKSGALRLVLLNFAADVASAFIFLAPRVGCID
jgi:hypothetical protein